MYIYTNISLFQMGETWLNDDCTEEMSCVECASCTRPTGEVSSQNMMCESPQICSTSGQYSECLCEYIHYISMYR